MEVESLSPQEIRLLANQGDILFSKEAQEKRPRIQKILQSFRKEKPRMSLQRAMLMTEFWQQSEGMPLSLRWGKAVRHMLENIDVCIEPHELIVGRCGPSGRYGILYPEVRSKWLEQVIEAYEAGDALSYTITEEEAKQLKEVIIPFWKGRTLFDRHFEMLPEATKEILYDEDNFGPSFVVVESSTERHALQWILDFKKVLQYGTDAIKAKAQARLEALDPLNPHESMDKAPFLRGVIEVCTGIENFALRYSQKAFELAQTETDAARKEELLTMAAMCTRVPMKPAGSFWEAVQSQWFAQIIFRVEHYTAGGQGQGRIDQYLYEYYKKDKDAGIIDDNRTLELLECLWLKVAESMTMRQAFASPHKQGNAHYEATTIGGQCPDGTDATNELSYLILESKYNFPLDYPDLSARIHARTPEKFLAAVCEVVREGTGFPKLFNDEEIIPYFLERGIPLAEAREYCVSGCTEVRLPNRDVYLTGHCQINMGAVLEMTMSRGKLALKGGKKFGIDTGNPCDFTSFEDLWEAFTAQLNHCIKHVFIQNQTFDNLKADYLAAPFMSMLHDLCMDQCRDIHKGDQQGALKIGFWEPTGFATVVDTLAAIKKLVFDEASVSMEQLLQALDNNFENATIIRQRCINAPKFGNNDAYADDIGRRFESYCRELSHSFKTLTGGQLDVRYVPVTAHVPFGRMVGATANGRLAKEPLSDGIAPQQGSDMQGPTAVLLSVAHTKQSIYSEGAARLFNMKLSPQAVNGPAGLKRLMALIRTWCDLKLWHIQFNVVNNETLRAAAKDPQKFRNLIVRVAGYSAYFVDLSEDLREEIIKRTEHGFN